MYLYSLRIEGNICLELVEEVHLQRAAEVYQHVLGDKEMSVTVHNLDLEAFAKAAEDMFDEDPSEDMLNILEVEPVFVLNCSYEHLSEMLKWQNLQQSVPVPHPVPPFSLN